MRQTTFVTAWFRKHGIAYLDIVVKALDGVVGKLAGSTPEVLLGERDQYDIASEIGYCGTGKNPVLSRIDRVLLLLPGDQRADAGYRLPELAPEQWARLANSPGASDAEHEFAGLRRVLEEERRFPPLEWFEEHWRGREGLLWHLINEAPPQTQLDWYRRYSPLFKANEKRIELIPLEIDDLEDPVEVTSVMCNWLESRSSGGDDDRLLVNLYGTATAFQFGWYYLAWRQPALKGAIYLKCWDKKEARGDRRFAPISIEVLNKDPIGDLVNPPPRKPWESLNRNCAREWLRLYLCQKDNFSILILGERGTGKSEAVREAWKAVGGPEDKAITANCADFKDPIHARSELFGHVKGAFTGATEKRMGLLERAKGGLLFLDEVHHLDEQTRSMLLTALQTDRKGFFSFAPLGSSEKIKAKFQPVFASNLRLEEFTAKLPPDFRDRISQRFLRWPEIEEDELAGAWDDVWDRMDFKGPNVSNPSAENWFLGWLRDQPRSGNFRDLQRIAILVADFQRAMASESTRELLLPGGPPLRSYLESRLAATAAQPKGAVTKVPSDTDSSEETDWT